MRIGKHYSFLDILAMVPSIKYIIKSIIISLSLITGSCYAQEPKSIRVAILQDADFVRLKVSGIFEVIDYSTGKVIYRGKDLNTTVTAYKYGILLGSVRSDSAKLLIKSLDPDSITVDGRKFRDNIEFIKKNSRSLVVINIINLEDYVKGILYHEVSHYWPDEILKAQAIVSRTYALYQMEENKDKDYDLTNDIYSQVYGGRTSERYRTSRAVDETKGSVLYFKGNILPAYYHATCAGHTEDVSRLWDLDIAPLKGVVCSFCKESPHFSWHAVLSLDEVSGSLRKAGYSGVGKIKDIIAGPRDDSGRLTGLKILGSNKEIDIAAKDFRNAIGPNVIRSTNFSVTISAQDVVFEGVGWGHGVGMCQWGGYFMAKQGYSYKQILQYYYPGADVKTI